MSTAKWVIIKYSELWNKKKSQEFTLDECAKLLRQQKAVAAVILSQFRKAGWLTVQFDPKDSRKRIYHLKEPEEMIAIMGDMEHAENK